MKLAIFFGILTFVFLTLFICYLDLLIFFFREKKKYEKEGNEKEYLEKLEKRHKKSKHPFKKNLLLYLICLASAKQGFENKAKRLIPFVRTDVLLGIYPKKEQKEKNI